MKAQFVADLRTFLQAHVGDLGQGNHDLILRIMRNSRRYSLLDAFDKLDSFVQNMICRECPAFYAWLDPENDKGNN